MVGESVMLLRLDICQVVSAVCARYLVWWFGDLNQIGRLRDAKLHVFLGGILGC